MSLRGWHRRRHTPIIPAEGATSDRLLRPSTAVCKGNAVERKRQVSVVILYTHPLLGEGIAKLLAGEPGLTITHIPSREAEAAEAAFATVPDVVIFERSEPLQAIDLLKFAPDALLIDVGMDTGPTFSYHREEIPARPEGILRAIRHMRRASRGTAADAVAILATASAASGAIGGS